MNQEDIIITQRIDSIGRIVIPKNVRDIMNISPGDSIEIAVRRKIEPD